jgi:hypothetical protein
MSAIVFRGFACKTGGKLIPPKPSLNKPHKWELAAGYIETGLKRTEYWLESGSPEAYELLISIVNAETDDELCAIVSRYGHVGAFSRQRRETESSAVNEVRRLVQDLRKVAGLAVGREFSKIGVPDGFWPKGRRSSMDFRFFLVPPNYWSVFYTDNLYLFAWHEIIVLALGGRPLTMCKACSAFLDPVRRRDAMFCSGTCRTDHHRGIKRARQYLATIAAEASQ